MSYRGVDRLNARRVAPFAVAAAVALATALIPPSPSPLYLVLAALITALLVACPVLFAWARPPQPLSVLPPLVFLLVVAILRDATGGSGSGFAPLAMLSIFWVALYGRRWQLMLVIGGVGVLFLAPLLDFLGGDYGTKDIRYSIISVAIASLIGLTAQTLVTRQREQGRQLSEQHDFLDAMFDGAGSLVAVLDPDGRVRRINPACEEVGGFAQAEIQGRYFWEVLLPAARTEAAARRWREGGPADLAGVTETSMVSRDGGVHTIHWTVAPLGDGRGGVAAYVATGLDVSEERAAREQLRAERDRFDSVLRAATEYSIIGADTEGRITVYNEGAERMLGYAAAEMIGKTPELIHLPEEVEARAAELGIEPGFEVFVHEARDGRADTRDWTYVRADGTHTRVSLTVTAIAGPEGEPEGFIGIATDVKAAREAEAALAESEYRFRTLVEHLPDAVVALYDRDLRLQMAEGPMLRRQGLEPPSLIGKTPEEILPEENAALLRGPMEAALNGDSETIEYESHINGVVYEIEVVPYRREGRVAGAFTVSRDITVRKRYERELRQLAERDSLTGLLNRRRFEEELRRHVLHVARYGAAGALIVFDIDDFKSVNDSLGHAVGDELIVSIARAVGEQLRRSDSFARLGGDEFAVLLPEADREDAAAVAAKLVKTAREDCGVELPGGARHCAISVGAVLFTDGGRDGHEQALVAADLAMYEAKRAGGDRYHLLSPPAPRRPRGSGRDAASESARRAPGR